MQKRAVVNYLAPQFKGNEDLSLSFTALYDESFDVNTFNAKRQEGSVQLSQREPTDFRQTRNRSRNASAIAGYLAARSVASPMSSGSRYNSAAPVSKNSINFHSRDRTAPDGRLWINKAHKFSYDKTAPVDVTRFVDGSGQEKGSYLEVA